MSEEITQEAETAETPEQIIESPPTEGTGEQLELQGTEGEQTEPTPYTPNFEFTVKDKKLEFDEWARPFVTDSEKEAKFREVFEKAHGLEEVKSHRDAIRDENKTLKDENTRINEGLSTVNTYLQNNDMKSFFEALGVPKEKILRYAVDELKYQEMAPEERQEYDAYRQQQTKLSQLELNNQQMYQQNQEMVKQQAEFALTQEMSKPDISQIAQAYDTRVGQPGAFKKEVINRGIQYEVQGTVITAAQAVQEIAQLVGHTASQQATAPTHAAPTPSQVVATQQSKPVIPNVQGGGSSSPYKKQPNSLDDLKKLREQMMNSNA